MRLAALVFLAALAPAARPAPGCEAGAVMSPAGIGALRVGITPDSLARVCRVVGSRKLPEYGQTTYLVAIGADTVHATEYGGVIRYIEVASPRIRTLDSLGVGAAAARLLHLDDLTGGAGDGADTFELTARSGPHCGLVFWLDAPTAEMLNRGRGDPIRLLGMRGGGVVTQVDIRGACNRRDER